MKLILKVLCCRISQLLFCTALILQSAAAQSDDVKGPPVPTAQPFEYDARQNPAAPSSDLDIITDIVTDGSIDMFQVYINSLQEMEAVGGPPIFTNGAGGAGGIAANQEIILPCNCPVEVPNTVGDPNSTVDGNTVTTYQKSQCAGASPTCGEQTCQLIETTHTYVAARPAIPPTPEVRDPATKKIIQRGSRGQKAVPAKWNTSSKRGAPVSCN